MHLFSDAKDFVNEFVSENSSTLLTAGGVVGVISTAVLAGRAGFKLGHVSMEMKVHRVAEELDEATETNPYLAAHVAEIPKKNIIIAAAPELIPPVITVVTTIGAIVLLNRMSAQKAAALAAAYGLAERNLSEYKAKVEEKLTGPKQTAITDELAQEAIDRTPGSGNIVVIEGDVLCFDKPGGRYFNSSMEKIRQAVNKTNAEVYDSGFARLEFFYDQLGLEETPWSDELGFNAENILELNYTAALKQGRPCVVIDFVRLPKADFHPKHY